VELRRSGEFATRIIYAMETGNPVKIYANVKNRGVIENLPYESVVEVPALVDRRGGSPYLRGPLAASVGGAQRHGHKRTRAGGEGDRGKEQGEGVPGAAR